MIRILKGLVVLAVAVFSLNNPGAAANYVVRAIRSVEQIVVSVAQDAGGSSSPGSSSGSSSPASVVPGSAGEAGSSGGDR